MLTPSSALLHNWHRKGDVALGATYLTDIKETTWAVYAGDCERQVSPEGSPHQQK